MASEVVYTGSWFPLVAPKFAHLQDYQFLFSRGAKPASKTFPPADESGLPVALPFLLPPCTQLLPEVCRTVQALQMQLNGEVYGAEDLSSYGQQPTLSLPSGF